MMPREALLLLDVDSLVSLTPFFVAAFNGRAIVSSPIATLQIQTESRFFFIR